MSEPVVRIAQADEHEAVARFYQSEEGRSRATEPTDTIVLAEVDGAILGVVRLCEEHEFLVLRGMRVRTDSQRHGFGSRLLAVAAELIGGRCCYCLPFAHLTAFYARAGFVPVPEEQLPPFLRARSERYRRTGDDIAPMLRGRI